MKTAPLKFAGAKDLVHCSMTPGSELLNKAKSTMDIIPYFSELSSAIECGQPTDTAALSNAFTG